MNAETAKSLENVMFSRLFFVKLFRGDRLPPSVRTCAFTLLPKADENFESAAYRKTCLRFFKLMCATPLGKICVSDHAMNATEEMSAMNRDIKRFFDENGAEYPTWKELEKEAGEYLKDKNRFERQNKRGQSVRTAP